MIVILFSLYSTIIYTFHIVFLCVYENKHILILISIADSNLNNYNTILCYPYFTNTHPARSSR